MAAARGSVAVHGRAASASKRQPGIVRAAKGSEPGMMRCVPCVLHGVLCNTPGKLLLLEDRLVFAAAEANSSQQQQQPVAAGSSSSSMQGIVLASMPAASVERVVVRQGWVGSSWLAVSGGGRQLLLGDFQPNVGADVQAELLQRVSGLKGGS